MGCGAAKETDWGRECMHWELWELALFWWSRKGESGGCWICIFSFERTKGVCLSSV